MGGGIYSFHPFEKRRSFVCCSSRGLACVHLYDCSFGLFLVVGKRYGHLDDSVVVLGEVKGEREDSRTYGVKLLDEYGYVRLCWKNGSVSNGY